MSIMNALTFMKVEEVEMDWAQIMFNNMFNVG
jgi:hypothetical protein